MQRYLGEEPKENSILSLFIFIQHPQYFSAISENTDCGVEADFKGGCLKYYILVFKSRERNLSIFLIIKDNQDGKLVTAFSKTYLS